MKKDKTSIICEGAEISKDVEIGPFCKIGPKVKLGPGTKIHSHVIIEGRTKIGANNEIFPFCSIGNAPQDLSYNDEDTCLEIGDHNTFREFVSIHRGTTKQDLKTIIGNNNYIMAYGHIGHDVVLGNNIRLVNACNLAGHVSVGNDSILSGGTIVAQFVRIGEGSFIGGGTVIDKEIPPYCTAYGNRVKLKGINIIGLKRRSFSKVFISELVDFFRSMEASHLGAKAYLESDSFKENFKGSDNDMLLKFVSFIKESKVGLAGFMS